MDYLLNNKFKIKIMAIITQEFFAKLQKYNFIYIKHPGCEFTRNKDFILDIHHDKTDKKYYLKEVKELKV